MEQYSIGKGTVLSIIEAHGVPKRNQGLAPENVPEAVQRYKAGESLASVGARLGCNANVVRRHLVEAGVTIRPRNGFGHFEH
jgi:hypothetical protein